MNNDQQHTESAAAPTVPAAKQTSKPQEFAAVLMPTSPLATGNRKGRLKMRAVLVPATAVLICIVIILAAIALQKALGQ